MTGAQYVFIGEVVGIVGPAKYNSDRVRPKPEAYGVRVKVIESIYTPGTPAAFFEVFPFGIDSACGHLHWPWGDISKHFPVGSQVRVVAKEAEVLPKQSEDGVPRLEATVYNKGVVSRNERSESPRAAADSVFEYGKVEAQYDLPRFELRKDWLRLMSAESEGERVKILERLVYYPFFYELDFPHLAQTYVHDRGVLARLREKWDARKPRR